MNRRNVIKYTALITGASLSVPLAVSLLPGCIPDPQAHTGSTTLHFFTEREFRLLQVIADTILPGTDSPSASEMNVHMTIDSMVGTVYAVRDRKAYRNRFTALAGFLNGDKRNGFLKLEEAKRLERLELLEKASPEPSALVKDAYREVKQQVIAYYLSSERIGKEFLNYLPIPGPYEACISLESAGGKAWSL